MCADGFVLGDREVAEAKKKRLVAVTCLMAAKVRGRAASVGLKGGSEAKKKKLVAVTCLMAAKVRGREYVKCGREGSGGGKEDAACGGDVLDGCQGEGTGVCQVWREGSGGGKEDAACGGEVHGGC